MQLMSSGVYVANFKQIQRNINLNSLLCLIMILGISLWVELSSNFGVLEVVTQSCSKNQTLLKISQNSQENTCVGVYFFLVARCSPA